MSGRGSAMARWMRALAVSNETGRGVCASSSACSPATFQIGMPLDECCSLFELNHERLLWDGTTLDKVQDTRTFRCQAIFVSGFSEALQCILKLRQSCWLALFSCIPPKHLWVGGRSRGEDAATKVGCLQIGGNYVPKRSFM